ncbi:putative invertase inhibitor [Salvia miltiorrhiza]|uniref:putative invertase inhibitor n=1 Tax=Salvia miltiorrhiza TaxID=226208 RepID=UPI0025AD0314|nr:putative invertase inhibitor [Salvia miltiorrhiza]
MKASLNLISLTSMIPLVVMIQITSGESLINSTCLDSARDDPNIDYAFCTSSLQAAPGSHCATLQGLGIISITLLQSNITDTRCSIKHLIRNSTSEEPYLRRCLSDCLELFSDAIPSAIEAMRDFTLKRFEDANVKISSIMDAATTCEDGFKESRGLVSPLTIRNHHTFELSAIALSLMHIIQTRTG